MILSSSFNTSALLARYKEYWQLALSDMCMSILVKSNAMHKVSKEKITEKTELEKQLTDKLLQRKNYE